MAGWLTRSLRICAVRSSAARYRMAPGCPPSVNSRIPLRCERRSDHSGVTIRVLTAMGLLSTRNGSRTMVTAGSDTLLAMSIASVIQFEKMTAADVFGLLGALNACAVEQAVERASEEDIARLRAAAERAAEVVDVESGAAALQHYFVTLSAISHNPLLAALCRVITKIQIGLAITLSRGKHRAVLATRRGDRCMGLRMGHIVDAIAQQRFRSRRPTRSATTTGCGQDRQTHPVHRPRKPRNSGRPTQGSP